MGAILEVKDLCKTYIVNKRQNHVLRNVNFTLKEGEFVAVMGPSGSGKSTLLYTVSGMDKATAGEILFDGEDLSKLSENKMAEKRLSKMGFVFQQMHLLKNLCIYDNIILPGYVENKSKRKDINAYAKSLMNKLDISDVSENDNTEVSGGQLQRACICRALINKPKVVFADEPTGALNSRAAGEVMNIFSKINQEGTTIMLVTHDVKVAARTERIMFIIDGNIQGELALGKLEKEASLKDREIKVNAWLIDKGW